MYKIIICIIVLLSSAASGFGATYFVSTTGSSMAPYSTEETAARSIATVITYIKNSADSTDTIYIAPGIYSGGDNYIILDHPNHANLTIIGSGRSSTIIDSNDNVIYGMNEYVDNISINDLMLRVSTANKQAIMVVDGSDYWTIKNVDILSCGLHDHHLANFCGSNGLMFNSVRFLGCNVIDKYPLVLNGNTSGTVNDCIFTSNGSGLIDFVYVNSTDSLTFNNCIFDNQRSHCIYKKNKGILTINNCVLSGSVASGAAYPIWNNGSGSVNVYNCNIIANPWDGDTKWIYGTALESNNTKNNENTYFASYRGGYIIPCVDDAGNYSYAKLIADLLEAHSMSGTFYVEQCGWDNADNGKLIAMNNAGIMELAIHSWSHINLTYDHALTINYIGSDSNPTCAFDGLTITFYTNERNDYATIDVTDSSTDTLAEIIAAAPANWSIEYSTKDGQSKGNFHTGMQRATSLKIKSESAVPCDIDFLRTTHNEGLLYDEITAPKKWLESVLGETVVSFGYPYNIGDRVTQAATIAAGYTNSRYNVNSVSIGLLTEINLHSLYVITNQLIGANEAATRQNARALAYATQQSGLITFFLGHNLDEVSLEEWTWILDEWAKFDGVKVCSAKTAVHEIVSEGDWFEGNRGKYSRVYPVNDYALTDASPWNIPSINITESISLPFAVPFLSIITDGMHVELSWTSVGKAEGYTLYYAPFPDVSYIGKIDMEIQTNVSGEFQGNASYYVAIQAYNNIGNSNISNIGYFIIESDDHI